MYFLDTDICIYLLTGRVPEVERRLRDVALNEIGTTAITAAELRFGALKSTRPRQNMARVESFLSPLSLAAFDDRAAIHFAQLKAVLSKSGKLIGPMDLLIAAICLANKATLVTNNIREFSKVPGLLVDNWSKRA